VREDYIFIGLIIILNLSLDLTSDGFFNF